jgi:hypothetical protein
MDVIAPHETNTLEKMIVTRYFKKIIASFFTIAIDPFSMPIEILL